MDRGSMVKIIDVVDVAGRREEVHCWPTSSEQGNRKPSNDKGLGSPGYVTSLRMARRRGSTNGERFYASGARRPGPESVLDQRLAGGPTHCRRRARARPRTVAAAE